jgi:hypothetical protein
VLRRNRQLHAGEEHQYEMVSVGEVANKTPMCAEETGRRLPVAGR